MADFPDDILRQIFSFLEQETLVQCRLLSRSVEPLARALAFRSVRLERARDVELFVNIARSERLRPVVRELTMDLSQGQIPASDAAEYGARIKEHQRTVMALPLVRLFCGLRTLNLRYGRRRGAGGYPGRWDIREDDVVMDPRFLPVVDTTMCTEIVLQCISGSWTEKAQGEWEDRWRWWYKSRVEALRSLSLAPGLEDDPDLFGAVQQSFPGKAISVTTLTISNLPEKDSEYLMSTSAMARFLETESLSKLKLLTTPEEHTIASLSPFTIDDRYKFFDNLPATWLSPSIADRLRTLSLFSHEYWGWSPKMDFRALSRGPNGTGGLSNLRTLALGRFVFSHQWQVDWITQLGSDNGRGGLEELYLDDCPIMWRARYFGAVDSEGFPHRETIAAADAPPAAAHPPAAQPNSWDPVHVDVDLRWSAVLRQWREKMSSLKAFRMGYGDWYGKYSPDVAMAQTACRTRVSDDAYMLAKSRNEDTVHLNYDKYFMDDCHKHGQDIIRDGVGLSQRRECVLGYVHYQGALGSAPWVERDFKDALVNEFVDGYQRYEEARRQDEEALYALCTSVGSP